MIEIQAQHYTNKKLKRFYFKRLIKILILLSLTVIFLYLFFGFAIGQIIGAYKDLKGFQDIEAQIYARELDINVALATLKKQEE
ncbi:MAG: hypothetical protein LBT79_07365 [Elusimicrobiota bacterium]|jgi:predicted PurR-regulated permease PerM|nr:hypothetical protein [Elusimicrobiota bacterium]